MGKNSGIEFLVGMAGITIGLVGIGYAIGVKNKTVDNLANGIVVDIPKDIVDRAVDKAVTTEANRAVKQAVDNVMRDVGFKTHMQVSSAVEKEYENLKDRVLEEMTNKVSKIDETRLRNDVLKAAKEKVIEKFDDNLDDILEKFNDDLENISKIYKSIAKTITRDDDREMVFRIR